MNTERWEYFHEIQIINSELHPKTRVWELHIESVRDKTTGEIVARFHDKRYAMMFAAAPDLLKKLIEIIGDARSSCDPEEFIRGIIDDGEIKSIIESATGLPIEEVLK